MEMQLTLGRVNVRDRRKFASKGHSVTCAGIMSKVQLFGQAREGVEIWPKEEAVRRRVNFEEWFDVVSE